MVIFDFMKWQEIAYSPMKPTKGKSAKNWKTLVDFYVAFKLDLAADWLKWKLYRNRLYQGMGIMIDILISTDMTTQSYSG